MSNSDERRKPTKLYLVLERLVGTAEYEIEATSKREAMEKLRKAKHGGMLESRVDHTGTGTAEVISDA